MKYTVIPDSVRIDPVNVRLHEHQPTLYKRTVPADYLYNNTVWTEKERVVRLSAARNETVAFQVVLFFENACRNVSAELKSAESPELFSGRNVELFKEWFVQVQTPSSGYEKTSMGPGWYPDGLIPLATPGRENWGAPFAVPDFWNRIPGQKAAVIWADLYVPSGTGAGRYKAEVTVSAKGLDTPIRIPVELTVWPFTLPNEDSLKGNFFTGAYKHWSHEKELRHQQMFKRHRIAVHQCYYRPLVKCDPGTLQVDWTQYDARLSKYFDGSAFTSSHGYYGTGYGELLEYLLLPFNVTGHRNSKGWPFDTAGPRDETFWKQLDYVCAETRKHLFEEGRVNLKKTKIQLFLNGLDECYTREAHDEMKVWSRYFKKYFPEASYRIDGGYDDETMDYLGKGTVDLCLYHTGGYDMPKVERNRARGVTDWIYGPVVYESKTNMLTGASSFIDLSMLTQRGLSWLVHKYKAQSWCQWEFMFDHALAWFNPETFKNNHLEEFRCFNGNGTLIYDGEALGLPDPVVSMRIKATRTGSQEWEYLKLYEQRVGNTASVVDKLIDAPLGAQCIGNLEPWNCDISAWDRARLEMGAAIANKS